MSPRNMSQKGPQKGVRESRNLCNFPTGPILGTEGVTRSSEVTCTNMFRWFRSESVTVLAVCLQWGRSTSENQSQEEVQKSGCTSNKQQLLPQQSRLPKRGGGVERSPLSHPPYLRFVVRTRFLSLYVSIVETEIQIQEWARCMDSPWLQQFTI